MAHQRTNKPKKRDGGHDRTRSYDFQRVKSHLRPPGPEPRKSKFQMLLLMSLRSQRIIVSLPQLYRSCTEPDTIGGDRCTRHRLTGSGPRYCASRKPQTVSAHGNCTFYPNSPPMLIFLATLLGYLSSTLHSPVALELENLALRHPVALLQRPARKRSKLTRADRLSWGWRYRPWNDWRSALIIVETVVAWHRTGLRGFWTSGFNGYARGDLSKHLVAEH